MIPIHTAQSQAPFVDLATQYAGIAQEIDAAVSKLIRETDFILGREVVNTRLASRFAASRT